MLNLGTIRQAGFVVPDIQAAMLHWTTVMGVGPFFYVERAPIRNYRFRGKPYDVNLSAALAYSGSLQIELIQPRDDTPSMYAEFIQAGRWGLQHVAFWTEQFDRDVAVLEARGHSIAMSGEVGANGRFAYFDTEHHPGTVIELSEISGQKGAAYKTIHDVALDWDGAYPIRSFPTIA